jgi:hypothetical protein
VIETACTTSEAAEGRDDSDGFLDPTFAGTELLLIR